VDNTAIDDMLNRAFRLAYFIHGNKETAVRIVSGAMAKLEVAAAAQGKRLYYRPAGRSLFRRPRSIGFRSKVTFSELHLLQRLIYIESELYEKQKELASSGAAVGKEDMIIHFIKHLVRITLKRNSFYVTLGLSRLLYNYTTTETMGIYNVVVQDPDRVKDDYYYRSRKGVLMQEIKQRFGDLVKTCHGQRGEERFQAEPNADGFAGLVKECLSLFTPWDTPCLVPANFDPITDTIPSLLHESGQKEDKIEVNRIHAALHPDCYQRLIKALGFHDPEQRLEVPVFFLSDENGHGGESSRPTQKLGQEDLNTIKNHLDELAERRRRASTGLLRVIIDGAEYARLDYKRAPHVRFNLDGWPELIEIRTADESGDLLLASHLLTYHEGGEAKTTKSSIPLEGGQNLSVVIFSSGDTSGQVVDVGYQETNPIKAAALMFRPLSPAPAVQWFFAGGRRSFEGSRFKVLISVSALILLLIFAAGVVRYMQRGENQSDSRAVANGNQTQPTATAGNSIPETGTSANPKSPGSPQRSGSNGAQPHDESSRSTQPPAQLNPGSLDREKRLLPNEDAARHSASGERQSTPPGEMSREEEATRALRRAESPLSLLDVKTIFVEVIENGPSDQALREMLVKKLQASDRLTLSKTRDEADALLRVTTSQVQTRAGVQFLRSTVAAQLINAQGQVIWPLNGASWQGTYSGSTPGHVSDQILKALFADVERLRRQR
jgi:hypothetical protein